MAPRQIATPARYASLVGYVTVSLADKPGGTPSPTPSPTPSRGSGRVLLQEKRKRKTVKATDNQGRQKRSRVAIDFTQTVTITMVQAGKGDCRWRNQRHVEKPPAADAHSVAGQLAPRGELHAF